VGDDQGGLFDRIAGTLEFTSVPAQADRDQ
jgi:hypothetical protein